MIKLNETSSLFGNLIQNKTKINREDLSNFLYQNLKDLSLDEFVGLITNKFQEIIEYSLLYQGNRTCAKTSLLFNPHRLNITTSQGTDVYSSLKTKKFIDGLARAIIWKMETRKTPNLLYSALEIGVSGRCFPSDFSPYIARKLAVLFKLNSQSNVLDPCAGWGGRMIGLSTVVNNYHCYEPSTKTFRGLLKLKKFLQSFRDDFKPKIFYLPFEDAKLKDNYYDFALTSPPYFDTERYSDEETDSCNRYKTFDDWTKYFYLPLIEKTMISLKENGYFILNIGSRKYPLSTILKENFKNKYQLIRLTDYLSNKGLSGRDKKEGETFYLITNKNNKVRIGEKV